MPTKVSPVELLILLIVVLFFFGPRRLPEIGRSLGRGIREFRGSVAGADETTAEKDDPS